MMKKLRKSPGIVVGRYRVRQLMARLSLKGKTRVAYKATTKRSIQIPVTDNLLNQNFKPQQTKQGLGG